MTSKLYDHQIEAISKFCDAPFGALFLSCGTGKSATALYIAQHKFVIRQISALLIIAPNGVHAQWAHEQIPQWLKVPYEVVVYGGRAGTKKTTPFKDPMKLHIVCCNYDTFSTKDKWKDVVEWVNISDSMIIADEATYIKSPKAKRTQRILYGFNKVQKQGRAIVSSTPLTQARLILTGTPITNGALDLWSMFEFLSPNFFKKNWYSFQNHYSMMWTHPAIGQRVVMNAKAWEAIKRCNTCNEAMQKYGVSDDTYNIVQSQSQWSGPYKNLDELLKCIEPYCCIKRLEDCMSMPDQVYITRHVEATPEQRRYYTDMAKDLMVVIEDKYASAASKVVALIRLQAITSGFLPMWDVSTLEAQGEHADALPSPLITWISEAKIEALLADLEGSLFAEERCPCIVITHFTAEAAKLYDILKEKYSTCLMTGWKKIGTIEEFQKGAYDVMVANIRVISKGFNLQNSCRMFYYSNTFSLEDRIQSEARIFRAGQKEKCIYTDYVLTDSVDEDVVSALQNKRDMFEYIMSSRTTKNVTMDEKSYPVK